MEHVTKEGYDRWMQQRDEHLAQIHPQDNLRLLGRFNVHPDCISIALWDLWLDGLVSDERAASETAEHRSKCIVCQRNYESCKADKEGRRYETQLPSCVSPQDLHDWRAGKIDDATIESRTVEHRNICVHCEEEYQYYKAGKEGRWNAA